MAAKASKAEDVLESLREPKLRRVVDVDYDAVGDRIILLLACEHAAAIPSETWHWVKQARGRQSQDAVIERLTSKFLHTNFDCRDCCA